MFCKKSVLRTFANITGKHLCQSLFFNIFLLKKRLWHRCFPVIFAKFLRTPFSIEHLWRLLLDKFFNISLTTEPMFSHSFFQKLCACDILTNFSFLSLMAVVSIYNDFQITTLASQVWKKIKFAWNDFTYFPKFKQYQSKPKSQVHMHTIAFLSLWK